MSTPRFTRKPGNPEPERPHTCSGCDTRWSGGLTCHCSSRNCHLTFSGIATFDLHRAGDRCATIAELTPRGVIEVRPGVYGRPDPIKLPGDSPRSRTRATNGTRPR